MTAGALHLVGLLHVQVSPTGTVEDFGTMLTRKGSLLAKVNVLDVSLKTDELGEAATALRTHIVLSFLVHRGDMNFEAVPSTQNFITVRAVLLLTTLSMPIDARGVPFMALQIPLGLTRAANITQFTTFFLFLLFLIMKNADVTGERIMLANGLGAQRALLHLVSRVGVRYNHVPREITEKCTIAEITVASLHSLVHQADMSTQDVFPFVLLFALTASVPFGGHALFGGFFVDLAYVSSDALFAEECF